MRYCLNAIYLLLLAAASPLLLYARLRKGKYCTGWREKFLGHAPPSPGDRPVAWMHAVSVGEIKVLHTLVGRFAQRHPDWQVVVSTTTHTGYELARRLLPDHRVFYCPLDFSWAVEQAMRRVRPQLVVLAELELWPNLIAAAHRHGARVAVVNGRLSDRSFAGYCRMRWLLHGLFQQIDLVAAQNSDYADRFVQVGVPIQRVVTTGSIKFDGADTNRDNPVAKQLAKLANIQDQDIVFLAGSTQEGEEAMAVEAFLRLADRFPHLRLILVPRHPERFARVAAYLNRQSIPWCRRSQLESKPNQGRVLLVDAVGELAAWWAVAAIGFVGGSMGARGGQNMIEPAAYGVATCFGQHTQNFRDVVRLLVDEQAAVVVHDGEQMFQFVARCLEEPDYASRLGKRARQLVLDQAGAATRTLEALDPLLSVTHRRAA